MKKKLNFLTIAPNFSNKHGGIIVLHKLADLLAKFGELSYINSNTFKNSSATHLTEDQIKNLDFNHTIFIYPEIIVGNPYNAKHIVRWILNTPGIMGGDGKYQNTDMVYKYWNYFKIENNVLGELRCMDLKLDIFYNKNIKRSGECFMIRKGIFLNKELDKHSSDSLNLDYCEDDQHLSNIFNERKIFISYDTMTYCSIQAALCGCISIVIPDIEISKEEWIQKCPMAKYGIAYGLNDIQWAIDTMHLVKDNLIKIENESYFLIKDFISKCYKRVQFDEPPLPEDPSLPASNT